MQAKRKLLPILLVVIVAAVVIAACGGTAATASQEKTWFNFPAVPLNVKADGNVDVYGLGLGPVLPAALVQQLQGADVQQLEARAGANGIHVYANGEELPYLAWDTASATNLEAMAAALPGGAMVKDYLPWLRRVGLGVNLKLPAAEGKPLLSVPRWRGETAITTETPATVVGPLNLGISYDADGKPSIAGIPAGQLAKLGIPIPTLDPTTLALVKSLGLETLNVKTGANGIVLSSGEMALPSIAYDAKTLATLLAVAKPFLANDKATLAALEQLIPMLPNLDASFTVNFNGQPAEFALPDLPVKVGDDGALSIAGLALPGAALPAATLAQLASAGVQDVAINAKPDGIILTINGQSMPKINFTPDGLKLIATVASTVGGISPDLVTTGLDLLGKDGINTSIALPGSTSTATGGPPEPTFAPPELGDTPAPTLRLAVVVKDGQIASIGGLSAEQLGKLGVTLPPLPPAVADIIKSLDAKTMGIVTKPNALEISVNGTPATTIQYDKTSLAAAWNLAKPSLKGTPLEDPALQKLIEEQILPMLPGADVNIAITVE